MKLLSRDASYADAPTEGNFSRIIPTIYSSSIIQYQCFPINIVTHTMPLLSPGIRRILERETGIPFPRGSPVNTSAISSIRMGTPLDLAPCDGFISKLTPCILSLRKCCLLFGF